MKIRLWNFRVKYWRLKLTKGRRSKIKLRIDRNRVKYKPE